MFIDLAKSNENVAMVPAQTVDKNYEEYTRKKVLQAKEARSGQDMIGSPSESDYRAMLSSNMV